MARKKKIDKEALIPKDFPTSIIVLGIPFRIEFALDMKDDEWGETTVEDRLIKLNPLHHTSLHDTLLHEVLHAGIGIAGLSQLFTLKQEEAIVRCLENTISPYFKFPMTTEVK